LRKKVLAVDTGEPEVRRTTFWSSVTLICITLVTFLVPNTVATNKSKAIFGNASPSRNESFSFVVWGHPRGKASGELPIYFEEVLDRVSELGADLLIVTGDMIHGMWGEPADPEVIRGDWDKFDAGVSRLGIPIHRLPGNHDVHNFVTRDIYYERYPKVPYAFTFKSSRFILLDTIGIDQQKNNDKATWRGGILPFDDRQLDLVRDEIRKQEKYNHLFFFMHHPQPWSAPRGFWWKDVHPLLAGGKTRAVFAGTPWHFKYAHIEEDGIHYILSGCLPTPPLSYFRMFPNPAAWSLHKQLDNIQYVRVDGGKYTVQTIVIGALSSKALSWRFWDQVEEPPSRWSRKVMVRFHMKFHRFSNLVLAAVIFGGICIFSGIFFTILWMRCRNRKALSSPNPD
jgi:hypothetical protein